MKLCVISPSPDVGNSKKECSIENIEEITEGETQHQSVEISFLVTEEENEAKRKSNEKTNSPKMIIFVKLEIQNIALISRCKNNALENFFPNLCLFIAQIFESK